MLLQGTNVSFTDCVYVTDGDYKTHPGRTIPFLIFYIVQWTWQTVVPYWFGAALFGIKNFAWYEWFLMIGVNLCVALTTAVGTTHNHWAINKPILQLFLPSELPCYGIKFCFYILWCFHMLHVGLAGLYNGA